MPESDARPPENRGRSRGGLPPVETRWKKGQSGNPGGRPKTKPLTDAYRKYMSLIITQEIAKETRLPAGFVGITIAESIAIGQAFVAIKGSTIAAREIADRIEGRVVTPDDADAESAGPLYVVLRAPRPGDKPSAVKALPEAD